MEKFVVSSAPFIRSSNDINKMFIYVGVVSLLPAAYGILFFGINALFILLVSIGVCYLSECLYNLFANKKFKVDNLSFFVTGSLLALTMPLYMPLYIVAISAFFAIFVVKMAFGGLGKNKFNPAIVGRCLAGVIAASLGTQIFDVTINGETYTSLSQGGTNTILNLISGQAVGGVGTTCIIMLVLVFIFLVYSNVIDFKISVISILAFFLTSLTQFGLEQSLMNLCSGSFVFVAIFMMTDPNTSPNTLIGKVIYSVLFGVLSALVWKLGSIGENTVFVVALLVNLFVPMMDRYFVLKPLTLGGYRNAYKN